MTKSELLNIIADNNPTVDKKIVERLVNEVFDRIKLALLEGDRVQILGFGTFGVKTASQRKGRNPRTGNPIVIPAHKRPHFIGGKSLKDLLNGGKS